MVRLPLGAAELLVALGAAARLAVLAVQGTMVSCSIEVVCAACLTWATGDQRSQL